MDQSVPKTKTKTKTKPKPKPKTQTQIRQDHEWARKFPTFYFSSKAPQPTYGDLAAFMGSEDEMRSEARRRYGMPIAQRYIKAYHAADTSMQARMFFSAFQQVLTYINLQMPENNHDHPAWAEFTSAVESFCGRTGANVEIDKILHVLLEKRINSYENIHLRDDIKTLRQLIPCPPNTNTPSPELCELFGYLFVSDIHALVGQTFKYCR